MGVLRGRQNHVRWRASAPSFATGLTRPARSSHETRRCWKHRNPDASTLVMLLLVANLPSSHPALEIPPPPCSPSSLLRSPSVPPVLTLGGERVHLVDFDALVPGWEPGVHHHGVPVHEGDAVRPPPPMRRS